MISLSKSNLALAIATMLLSAASFGADPNALYKKEIRALKTGFSAIASSLKSSGRVERGERAGRRSATGARDGLESGGDFA
jgi:hypothetical protein